jgi:LPS-assembly protein
VYIVLRLTCLATAMLALSAGTAFSQAPPAQEQQPESDPVLSARQLSIDTEGKIYIAEGDVEVRVGDRVLRADRVIYDIDSQKLRAQGNVQITDSMGATEFADEIEADEDFQNGFATRFSARLQNNAVIASSTAIRQDGVRNSLDQVVYTGCPTCEDQEASPTWTLRARKATQNLDTQMITYRDAVLSVKGVPVFYAPYFAHPDPSSKRRSGLLAPDAGLSSKLGAFYEQPYYWAISPSQDITFRPLIASNVNPLVKFDYRKRFFSGYINLDGSFTNEKQFDSNGEKFGDLSWRSHLYGDGRFRINEDWNWGFGVESQSDDLYDRRYSIDGETDQRGLYSSQTRQLISQIFFTGQQPDFYLEGAAFTFQGLQLGSDDAQTPRVTPSLFAEKTFDLGAFGQIATSASGVALLRDVPQTLPTGDVVADSARVSAVADWGAQYVFGPGLVFEPFMYGRADAYRLDAGGTTDPRSVNRTMGLAGARWSGMARTSTSSSNLW